MSGVRFDVSDADLVTILSIVERARRDSTTWSYANVDPTSLAMDLTAAHRNGCPLKLDALLVAPHFEFWHDVAGIAEHLDRKTGKLRHHFLPRFSRSKAHA